jgi:uncharacterized protein
MSTRAPVVDAWMQHPTAGFLANPMFDSLRRWLGPDGIAAEVPLDATIAAYAEAGIHKALVCAWWGPEGPIISNDEVAAIVRSAPDLFVGVASADLARPMRAVAEVRRAVEELGFRAIRLLPWLWNLPPNDRRFYPIYATCVALGVPVCLQVGHTGPLRPSEPGRPIPYLDDVALEFPELTIVGGHIGFPWTDEMISLATKYPNVYIDTSAYKPKRYPPSLSAYLRSRGRRKVLFGTNYPMLQPGDCLDEVESLGLDEEALGLFLGGNASRVFALSL